MERIHLIGIGGSGLSAIAQVLIESGVRVSGSDRQFSPLVARLQAAGAQVVIGHRPENVLGADLVVRSSAVPDDNPEVHAARQAGIPVLKRVDFLERLIGARRCLAVAGTHGKTTTTAMIAWLLATAGFDPSYIIGGISENLGGNAHAGASPLFVIEADEYDRMFLGLHPEVAVVTNIDHDHPDCFPTRQDFYEAFRQFAGQIQASGVLVACVDDPGAARLGHEAVQAGQQVSFYGVTPEGIEVTTKEMQAAEKLETSYQARSLQPNSKGGYSFTVDIQARPGRPEALRIPVELQVPGEHNVRNALAALVVADWLGLDLFQAAQALGEYRGVGRRFQVLGEAGGVVLIDDYAHHPSEIRATLAAARVRYPGREIWAVWQPHTYSRTRLLQADFAAAFGDADHVLVLPIYAAREAVPSDGFSAWQVVQTMEHPDVEYVDGLGQAEHVLLSRLRAGDVLLVLSAGDADSLNRRLLEILAAADPIPPSALTGAPLPDMGYQSKGEKRG